LRMALIPKALSVGIERAELHLLVFISAMVLAASSALLIVCPSGCDLISMCVVVCMVGFIIDASSVGMPVTWDPSV